MGIEGELKAIKLWLANLKAREFVEASYNSIAIFGQNPMTSVGISKLNPIVNSLVLISSTIARAGILGPKKTLLHIDRR